LEKIHCTHRSPSVPRTRVPAARVPAVHIRLPAARSESCFSSANKILSDKRSKLGAHVFERYVCLKDWIDVEERNQYRNQPQSFGVETEESGTEPRPSDNSDSDGAEESEQWYMNANY
jgi:hypothetical protein